MTHEFVGEFFIGDEVFESSRLGKDQCARVLAFAKSYARKTKRGMEKKKKFFFFPFRTGSQVDKETSVRVYISKRVVGTPTITLELIVEKYQDSFFPVDRKEGRVYTMIIAQ